MRRTLESGEAWFYSRSRQELWHKGETSGNVIKVNEVQVDCEGNSLIYRGEPTGPACHTGKPTCFFQTVEAKGLEFVDTDRDVVDELFAVIESRKRDAPEGSYVAKLLSEGVDRIGKKVIEEAGETVIAAKNGAADEIYGFLTAPEEAREDLLPLAVDAIKQTGALEETLQVANDYIETAVRSLDRIPPSDPLDSLLALAEYVQTRNY